MLGSKPKEVSVNRQQRKSNPMIGSMVIVSTLVLVLGCAHQPLLGEGDYPGFFFGILHGFLILFSLIASLFTDVRVYAFPNSGAWYDFGYFIGAAIFLGGAASGSRNQHRVASETECPNCGHPFEECSNCGWSSDD